MSSNLAAGKDILSYCNKCKNTLAHTIIVMADANTPDRVQCNTCKTSHKFKDPSSMVKKSASKKTFTKSSRSSSTQSSRMDLWEKTFGGVGASSSKINYTPKTTFKKGDLLDHPTYGMGLVEKLIDKNKIEVIFKSELKTLMHNL